MGPLWVGNGDFRHFVHIVRYNARVGVCERGDRGLLQGLLCMKCVLRGLRVGFAFILWADHIFENRLFFVRGGVAGGWFLQN